MKLKTTDELIVIRAYVFFLKENGEYEKKYPFKFLDHMLLGKSWKENIIKDAKDWALTDEGKTYIEDNVEVFSEAEIKMSQLRMIALPEYK